MNPPSGLSRREQQIMDIVYLLGEATVAEVHDRMDDPPTTMAVRRTMHILEEKGQLRRRHRERRVVFVPRRNRRQVGTQALRNVLATFFDGSVEDALAAHFLSADEELTDQEKAAIQKLIKQLAKKESS